MMSEVIGYCGFKSTDHTIFTRQGILRFKIGVPQQRLRYCNFKTT